MGSRPPPAPRIPECCPLLYSLARNYFNPFLSQKSWQSSPKPEFLNIAFRFTSDLVEK